MEGHASISTEILASYAADAAREVPGVTGLVEGHLPLPKRGGVRVVDEEGRLTLELHLQLAWGASAPEVGRAVQSRVRDYLGRMAGLDPASVNVVVNEISAPSER